MHCKLLAKTANKLLHPTHFGGPVSIVVKFLTGDVSREI